MARWYKCSFWGAAALLMWTGLLTDAFSQITPPSGTSLSRGRTIHTRNRSPTITKMSDRKDSNDNGLDVVQVFDDAVVNRYACTRFQRYDNNSTTTEVSSPSNPTIVKLAAACLELARRSPSGFNTQPYKLILVHTPAQKKALAHYCIGHNAHRVRDSDCTAVFLADREVVRTMGHFADFIKSTSPVWKQRKWAMLKMQALIALFSSGYPLSRFLAVPISFGVRVGVSIVSALTRRRILVPTLSNAETWSIKNTMLVAMTYMLGCTSRGVATCPMEGFNAGGIRKALKIPRRYSIPIIVATGSPYKRPTTVVETETDTSDDMGVTHGPPASGSKNATPRYPTEDVFFGDSFGKPMAIL
mmetsp:Transcript_14313/g.22342  ORF Transcript_14313/g.22342 Transcript_14313/m.22342 type:complete len:358 (+) Transcript_14313:109-1182(+)